MTDAGKRHPWQTGHIQEFIVAGFIGQVRVFLGFFDLDGCLLVELFEIFSIGHIAETEQFIIGEYRKRWVNRIVFDDFITPDPAAELRDHVCSSGQGINADLKEGQVFLFGIMVKCGDVHIAAYVEIRIIQAAVQLIKIPPGPGGHVDGFDGHGLFSSPLGAIFKTPHSNFRCNSLPKATWFEPAAEDRKPAN